MKNFQINFVIPTFSFTNFITICISSFLIRISSLFFE